MNRRDMIALLGGAAILPVAARAQQPMPVIGSVFGVSAAQQADNMSALRRGLSQMGFVEDHNVHIEYRWADGHFDRMPAMPADLISRKVDIILAGGNTAGVRAVISATQTIPIVFVTAADPVAAGLVASLNRPGGNATGVTNLNVELGSKRLELLHEVIPTATRMALLVNPNNPVISQGDIRVAQAAARRLGLEIVVVNGGSASEIDRGIASAVQQGAAALYVGVDAFFSGQREQIAALALRYALPTMLIAEAHTTGVLMSYVTNAKESYRQASVYVGRILKGEKPADLPVVQPTTFELSINLKTAKALGLTIPESFLLRADEVIE
jgi:putative ABC transport system substrate-binding protein